MLFISLFFFLLVVLALSPMARLDATRCHRSVSLSVFSVSLGYMYTNAPPSPPSVFILQSHLCLYLHPLTARLSVRYKGSQQYKTAIYITTPRCHHTSMLSHIETVSVVWCLTQGTHTHTHLPPHSCREHQFALRTIKGQTPILPLNNYR